MPAYLLTWNPKKFDWEYATRLVEYRQVGAIEGGWSTGATKKIAEGDRLFMMRQGTEPRGIIAAGRATSAVYQAEHWEDEDKSSNYVDFKFDVMIDYDKKILSRAELFRSFPSVNWDTQASGISISDKVLLPLEKRWSAITGRVLKPTASSDDKRVSTYSEGKARTVTLTKYERNPEARNKCIEHWGTSCCVCAFSFERHYGSYGRNFIHVHHLVPLSSIKKTYCLDPIKDLRPVCPNCHAMIHKNTSDQLSIPQLKSLLRAAAKNSAPSISHL